MAGFGVLHSQSKSAADKIAEKRRASRVIFESEETKEMIARRKKMEADPEKWLVHYGGSAMFPFPFSRGHKAIIKETIEACKLGSGSAVAAPRGEGKTTVLRGVAVYLLATRRVRFPVLVGWKHGDAKAALQSWLRMFTESERFREDYWKISKPFCHSTHATALKNLCWSKATRPTGAMVDNALKVITLPDSLGAIACRSAQGDAKGLSAIMPDGSILRPDFILFDDAQDPRKADNPTMVRKTIDVLENVFLGMGGPQTRITAAAACTVEAKDDVSCHWLSRQGWRSTRISRIEKWPGGLSGSDWPKGSEEYKKMWDEWNSLRVGVSEQDALKHYTKNKRKMTKGMEVSWSERYDRNRGDPDALYSAMRDYYDQGPHIFSRGQQNNPIQQGVTLYNLTPAVIQSRVGDRDPGDVPNWSVVKIAATDINASYGLTWSLVGFGRDQTAGVIGYGIYPTSVPNTATPAEWEAQVYEALVKHGQQLAALPCRPDTWFIDAGGTAFDVVIRFAANSIRACGLQAIACTGRGAKNYRPYGKTVLGTPREQCHMSMDAHRRRWVAFNADYWRERAQKSWTGSVGAPGSCSLPRGQHRDFAEQICREQLQGKADIGGSTVWVWNTAPGPHDYGDAMTMCFMGAAFAGGIGTGGARFATAPRAYRETRRPRVGIEL